MLHAGGRARAFGAAVAVAATLGVAGLAPDVKGQSHDKVDGIPSGVGMAPPVPEGRRFYLVSPIGRGLSGIGTIRTPDSGPAPPPPYLPHQRPQVRISVGDTLYLTFGSPAEHAEIVIQRPNSTGERGIAVARPIGSPTVGSGGFRWKITVPDVARIDDATTLRVRARFRGGSGIYQAGIKPISPRSPGSSGGGDTQVDAYR